MSLLTSELIATFNSAYHHNTRGSRSSSKGIDPCSKPIASFGKLEFNDRGSASVVCAIKLLVGFIRFQDVLAVESVGVLGP